MAIVSEGPGGGGDYNSGELDWFDFIVMVIVTVVSGVLDGSGGPTAQGGGGSKGKGLIMSEFDQMVGKIGPMVQEYNPELTSRMVEEY